MRAVAEAAGVSVATASMALRDLSRVNATTRARVREIAARLGYVRDPQLANAMSFARRPAKSIYRETIAFLADVPPTDYARHDWLAEMHAGATRQADRLGYGVARFAYPSSTRAQRILGRSLHARGIRGLVVTPAFVGRTAFRLDIPWDKFIAVEIGQTLASPELPRVVRDHPDDYAGLFEELRTRGYRRIGLAITDWEERRHRWAILSSYLSFNYRNPGIALIRPLADADPYSTDEGIGQWFDRERPDVVVTNGPELGAWLRKRGLAIPGDIGLCRIDCMEGRPDTGLRPDYTTIGRSAVTLLTSYLEHGEEEERRGRRPVLCIPHSWHEGETLRGRPDGSARPFPPPTPGDSQQKAAAGNRPPPRRKRETRTGAPTPVRS